ncbi:sporulation protein YunB [Bacillus sp. UNC438CL73TsuS30]|uniref:sporulation protein YunB n=1 Tax=Bacillus sp. UNC438CL73TsuS30 TaxID=1340434 RepID=UPI00047A49D4|nr:sporulation protein YunB [Bacillus sp. UNC438CL73TsuS30]
MAKFRPRYKRKGPLPLRYVMLLSFVFFLFSSALGLWMINKGLEPTLMRYAESQTRKIAASVINNAITKKTVDVGDVIGIEPGTNGNAQSAYLKTELINQKLSEITSQIQKNLSRAEKGDVDSLEQLTDVEIEKESTEKTDGIVWYVPLGQATNLALFGNLGPKIPVRFHAIGDVRPDVKISTEALGINNTWIKVNIHLEVAVQIITPFATKITKLTQNIPAGGKLIEGKVPQFYNSGGGLMPSIQLPDSTNSNKTTTTKEEKTKSKK